MVDIFLFLCEGLLYVAVMVALLHLRHLIGLGVFVAALGVLHFIETYLAAVFYVQLPIGSISPGSVVLFSGKLMMILLLYVKEDAATVRQPIYGLLAGNFLTVALGLLLQQHGGLITDSHRSADFAFLNEMGWLMVWGTVLLYIDSILIILMYERLGRHLRGAPGIRFFLCGATVLTFDQAGFYLALHAINGAPAEVFWSGWIAKMAAALFYSVVLGGYLHVLRFAPVNDPGRPIGDVFNTLTFRERYEDLLSRSGRDSLTGVFDRSRFEFLAPRLIRNATTSGNRISLMMIDADHFKSINDRFGHLEGDHVLKAIANALTLGLRQSDHLFRYGGEEFVVICEGLDPAHAMSRAEDIRQLVIGSVMTPDHMPVTISIGVAGAPADGETVNALLSAADERLYRAKKLGRNCVVGIQS
ncbi:diguanylate cyclase (GGDEF)-like protein [Pararhizobium capsulatum DSM 1112]|uniref:diguanylate cyclase n=1 Tax=Pararhizobium capsulatum DSM 1112 TaxID=1121113 RepID=A0ABU0BQ65_9HYPH|nr:diguanylate cyclase (GGDEF)-like protein [Pararhizobium capsulatum DSM 1112]